MSDPVERIMNLALAFTKARVPLTAEQVRDEVDGYDADQDAAAFARMFERDKEDLRRSGFVIEFDETEQVYTLNRLATFAAPIELSAQDTAALRYAGAALLSDESFPLADDLRLALAKIATDIDADTAPVPSHLADESPEEQGASAAALIDAANRRKRVSFGYTNSKGEKKHHENEPYGLFLNDGRWYLVGRDVDLDEPRTYAIARMEDLAVNLASPKTPDFERPQDFDVVHYIKLPFQYGPKSQQIDAVLKFSPDTAWRARALSHGRGRLESDGESVVWHVGSRSAEGLLRWVVENGPGISVEGPPELAERLRQAMAQVEALHG